MIAYKNALLTSNPTGNCTAVVPTPPTETKKKEKTKSILINFTLSRLNKIFLIAKKNITLLVKIA